LPIPADAILSLEAGVRTRWFDDELVAFSPASWETHILNAEAAAILARLACASHAVGELMRAYREAHPHMSAQACEEALNPLLLDLIGLGLARSSASTTERAAR
jgi:PqqD family protein of HPr-rel-A system